MTTQHESYPEAEIIPARPGGGRGIKATRMWWLTLVCLVTAVILVYLSLSPKGVRDTLHFDHGYGLEHGDPVRYRGIEVGVVDEIGIDAGHEGIEVEVRLLEYANRIARAGTRFWIERPRFDLGSIGGLDTLIGGRYIAVRTGPEAAPVQTRFEGSEAPPVGPAPAGGLDLVLEAPQRHGLTTKRLLHGDRDGIVPLSHGRALTEAFGGEAQLLVAPGYGHNDLPLDRDGPFGARIAAFLGQR